MSWRDRLLPGSFKGVPFQTDSVDTTFSRNIVSKNYLLTEDVSSKDLGRKPDEFKFDIFFLGDDYMEQRDAFLDLRKSSERGILIHPYYGSQEVLFRSCTVRETSQNGRMARVSVSFVEAGASKFPDITEDRTFKLNAAVTDVEDVAQTTFNENIRLTQVSDFVRQGTTGITDTIFTSMRDLVDAGAFVDSVATDIINSTDYINNFAQLRATFNQIISPVSTIISVPSAFSGLIRNAMNLINITGTNGKSARTVLKKAREAVTVLETEATQQIEYKNDNQEVTERFVKVTGVANEASTIQNMTFESRVAALEVRDDLVNQIDVLLESSKTDQEYQALKTLKSEVILYLPPEDLDLPRVRSIELSDTISSLLVSYEIYGSVEQESDIIMRNGIRHPAFLDPSKKLEVLVNE